MKKTIVIIHRNKVLFRDENYMKQNYSGSTLNEQVEDLIECNKFSNNHPVIIIQGKTVERIIRV